MKTRYQCEKCQELYDTPQEARECEASDKQPVCAVGDIVTLDKSYGWFIQEEWVSDRPGADFHGQSTYTFYYVVTAIDMVPRSKHRNRYHVATRATVEGNGVHGGWTTDDGGHYTPQFCNSAPARVVKAVKELVGKKFRELI